MAGNSFGEVFRITTFGESHGAGVGVVIDGGPSRMALSSEDFISAMARRRPGRSPQDTLRREPDQVEIFSGVFKGLTTGAPITLLIRNRDADSRPYEVLRRLFRPGHGDYTYFKKYGRLRDRLLNWRSWWARLLVKPSCPPREKGGRGRGSPLCLGSPDLPASQRRRLPCRRNEELRVRPPRSCRPNDIKEGTLCT